MCVCVCVCVCVCRGVLYVYVFYMFNLLSSPYLLVFGDDRVCGTREQMMLLQVVPVRLSYGAGIAWGTLYLLFLEMSCNPVFLQLWIL